MARALPWQRSDKGLKSMEPKRDKEPRSLTAMWGTNHHCSPFSALILLHDDPNDASVCVPPRSGTSEAKDPQVY